MFRRRSETGTDYQKDAAINAECRMLIRESHAWWSARFDQIIGWASACMLVICTSAIVRTAYWSITLADACRGNPDGYVLYCSQWWRCEGLLAIPRSTVSHVVLSMARQQSCVHSVTTNIPAPFTTLGKVLDHADMGASARLLSHSETKGYPQLSHAAA